MMLDGYVSLIEASTISQITSALTGFGTDLLRGFTDLLPALAGISAIFFVIGLIRSKVY